MSFLRRTAFFSIAYFIWMSMFWNGASAFAPLIPTTTTARTHRIGAATVETKVTNKTTQRPSKLSFSRNDSLIAGIAEISIGTSLAVLWSEGSIVLTGCGPLRLNDTLERVSYQAVLVAAGVCVFCRIAFGQSVSSLLDEYYYDDLEEITTLQVKVAEILAVVGVAGAFIALFTQISNGTDMDGLSGIDVEACRAQQAFRALYQ